MARNRQQRVATNPPPDRAERSARRHRTGGHAGAPPIGPLVDDTGFGPQQLQLPIFDWPDAELVPHNGPGTRVGSTVLPDLLQSRNPLVISGYASMDKVVNLLAEFTGSEQKQRVRVFFGNEPFQTDRAIIARAGAALAAEVADYWRERGFSVAMCSTVIAAIELLRSGVAQVRLAFQEPVHAKIYRGDDTVTLGSSNLTHPGLSGQIEANARFTSAHQSHFEAARQLGERIWETGRDYTADLELLLQELLRYGTWQEALARACAELLEGAWATRLVDATPGEGSPLWPSQLQGIAQGLWCLEHIGGVLVADATGSGKTRLGAHLIDAVMQRFLRGEGRAQQRDLRPLLICPPNVKDRWLAANNETGLRVEIQSDGVLSQGGAGQEQLANYIRRAQVLAIDEAHRFLNLPAERTRQLLRNNLADYVLLFTATPVSRGPKDLAGIVNLLGADNFDDALFDIVNRLVASRLGDEAEALDPGDREAFQRALQQFTVRRTKSVFNQLVDAEPDRYQATDGRPCRYPRHDARRYPCGETPDDRRVAREIQEILENLVGIANLRSDISIPPWHRRFLARTGQSEADYLRVRLLLAQGGARHNVRAALRSSRAALFEHLYGTRPAADRFGLGSVKTQDTGAVVFGLERRIETGPPRILLDATPPDWMVDPSEFRVACERELALYTRIGDLVLQLSDSRERTKAQVLLQLLEDHPIVLAFDNRLITLADMERRLSDAGECEVAIATGESRSGRRKVQAWAERGSSERRKIALCSDAMSEGFNLQGASAVQHLDMPTVVRQAEQRIGRVDRLDSPFETIEVWWPDDAPEFALRADERFIARHRFVADLLGANFKLPDPVVVATHEVIQEFEEKLEETREWDGLADAFEPVRQLVSGPTAILPRRTYDDMRESTARVLASVNVSSVSAERPWAFFAVRGTQWGAPRWVLLEDDPAPILDLETVAEHLRTHLAGRENRPPDQLLDITLRRFLERLTLAEWDLLPRRKRRALEEMRRTLQGYRHAATQPGDEHRREVADSLLGLIEPPRPVKWDELGIEAADRSVVDLAHLANRWLTIIHPAWEEYLRERAGQRLVRLRDLRGVLQRHPITNRELEELLKQARRVQPMDERVVAAIVGVADRTRTDVAPHRDTSMMEPPLPDLALNETTHGTDG